MALADAGAIRDAVVRALPWLATLALALSARRLSGRPRALFLVLLALSPLLLLYAAEARAYAILGCAALALFLRSSEERPAPASLVGIALLTAVALYLHYLAIFLAAALAAVAVGRRRFRSLAAILAGGALFLPWIPILRAQPAAATSWMREPVVSSAAGMLSGLGGAGRIPGPFGPPLPVWLFAAGVLLGALTIAALLASPNPRSRDAGAVSLIYLGLVLLVSLWRPVGFAGRSEMAILPIAIWGIAAASADSASARRVAAATAAVALVSTASLLPSLPGRAPEGSSLVSLACRTAGRNDVLVSAAGLYLPSRLAADRGRLAGRLWSVPADLERHPGWFEAVPFSESDRQNLYRRMEELPEDGRVFLLLPSLLFSSELAQELRIRGALHPVASAPGAVLFSWTPGPRLARGEGYRGAPPGGRVAIARSDIP